MIVLVAQENERQLAEHFFPDAEVQVMGVGMINAIKAAKAAPRGELIVNVGFCGSNVLAPGTDVVVKEVQTYHKTAKFEEEPIKLHMTPLIGSVAARCYTATDFVTESNTDEPAVFDMELAGIAAVRPDVFAIKCVSDTLSIDEYRTKVKGE